MDYTWEREVGVFEKEGSLEYLGEREFGVLKKRVGVPGRGRLDYLRRGLE